MNMSSCTDYLSIKFVLVMVLGNMMLVNGQNSYLERQLLCALDKAPCDLFGFQIKGALPEIIGRNCQTCDQKQFFNARRIAKFVQTRYPRAWTALVEKYSRKRSTN